MSTFYEIIICDYVLTFIWPSKYWLKECQIIVVQFKLFKNKTLLLLISYEV
jgi:hypothetical protein